jgi:hypothetical protein
MIGLMLESIMLLEQRRLQRLRFVGSLAGMSVGGKMRQLFLDALSKLSPI